MKKLKVLLMGDAEHTFIQNFAIYLKKHLSDGIIVDIYSSNVNTGEKSTEIFDNVFKIPTPPLKNAGIFKNLYFNLVKIPASFKKLSLQYDIVHIHQLMYNYAFILKDIVKDKSKIIVSLWGNDVNINNRIKDHFKKKVLKNSDLLACSSKSLLIKTLKKYNLKKIKTENIGYGLSPIEEIKKIKDTEKSWIKNKYSIAENKIVITCGYSNRSEHKQMDIMRILNEMNNKEDFVLILPMTYGNDRDNLNKVKEFSEERDYEVRIFVEYLSDEKIAELRKISDIFIHVVDHDQNSGSMIEYMYAGNITIVGEWLDYTHLEEMGLKFEKIDELKKMPLILKKILANDNSYYEKTRINTEIIDKFDNWDDKIKRWHEIYFKLLEQ